MTEENQTVSNSNYRVMIVVAVIVAAVVATGAGFAVHAADTSSSNHAMMEANAMQKDAIKKAETSAAMKQADSDKMAESEAMKTTASDSSMMDQ